MMTSEQSAVGQAIGLCRLSTARSDRPRKTMACPTSFAALVLLTVVASSAQQPPEPVAKFQATTQLVVETVSVKDKNGKPIEGLTSRIS